MMNAIKMISSQYQLYVFRLLFAILRPVRNKYNLSINCLIALNSCYLYSKLESQEFFMTDIYKFTKYYSIPFMKAYFRVLALRGFIIPDREGTFHTRYKISATGIQVIEEIEENYNKELYEFSNKYHLDL
jgi:hypothetical protein